MLPQLKVLLIADMEDISAKRLSKINCKFVIAHHGILTVAQTRHPWLELMLKMASSHFDGKNPALSQTNLANNFDAPHHLIHLPSCYD